MSFLNDRQIRELCNPNPTHIDPEGIEFRPTPMISPFVESNKQDGVISYGLSSFGYDIRAAPGTWKMFVGLDPEPVDPMRPNEKNFVNVETVENIAIAIPPGHYVLASSVEKFHMPDTVGAIAIGKSTYARVGIVIPMTPLEPGWVGYLTLEISNQSPKHVLVYPGQGIAQLMFFQGERPEVTYAERDGKYQNQPARPVLARIK